jgi:hypothetical protein
MAQVVGELPLPRGRSKATFYPPRDLPYDYVLKEIQLDNQTPLKAPGFQLVEPPGIDEPHEVRLYGGAGVGFQEFGDVFTALKSLELYTNGQHKLNLAHIL